LNRKKAKEIPSTDSDMSSMTISLYQVSLSIRALLLLVTWLSGSDLMLAHDLITTKITWSREISRIFHRRCAPCHQKGREAFDLTTYEQARPWAEAIKQEVLERRMPPWGAVKGFGEFRDDEGLTQEEIEIIAGWAEGGAPLGDAGLLPDKPDLSPKHQERAKTDRALLVNGQLTLKQDVTIAAIRPEALPKGASLRVLAESPDGRVEPLIWLYNFAPRFARVYYFQVPLHFRAGTVIRMQPAIGGVSLLLHNAETDMLKNTR
jgi:hypothetical protein